MLQISEVNIFSVDKSDDVWAIEGEIILEDSISNTFYADYDTLEDDFETLSFEDKFEEAISEKTLKKHIVKALNEFDEN